MAWRRGGGNCWSQDRAHRRRTDSTVPARPRQARLLPNSRLPRRGSLLGPPRIRVSLRSRRFRCRSRRQYSAWHLRDMAHRRHAEHWNPAPARRGAVSRQPCGQFRSALSQYSTFRAPQRALSHPFPETTALVRWNQSNKLFRQVKPEQPLWSCLRQELAAQKGPMLERTRRKVRFGARRRAASPRRLSNRLPSPSGQNAALLRRREQGSRDRRHVEFRESPSARWHP